MSLPAASRRPPTAWGAAIGLLARRDLSEGEIRAKLLAREYPGSDTEEAIVRLHERGYLDDRALALAVARKRGEQRLHGPIKVRAYLRERGIPEALADEALGAVFPEGVETERAARALERIARRSRGTDFRRNRDESAPPSPGRPDRRSAGRDRDRLLRRLLARGYSSEAARGAVADFVPAPDRAGEEDGAGGLRR